MKRYPKPVTRLTGRVLQRETRELIREYREVMSPIVDDARDELAERTYQIVSEWAERNYPPADMDVCERYGVVAHVEGVNVECFDAESRKRSAPGVFGRETYGLPFPEGKTVRVPESGWWAKAYASVDYRGQKAEDCSRSYSKSIPDLGPLIAHVREMVDELEGGAERFEAYVATRPLRRELAKHYPEVARRVWPEAMKETENA